VVPFISASLLHQDLHGLIVQIKKERILLCRELAVHY
jgi:hypothetical protein